MRRSPLFALVFSLILAAATLTGIAGCGDRAPDTAEDAMTTPATDFEDSEIDAPEAEELPGEEMPNAPANETEMMP